MTIDNHIDKLKRRQKTLTNEAARLRVESIMESNPIKRCNLAENTFEVEKELGIIHKVFSMVDGNSSEEAKDTEVLETSLKNNDKCENKNNISKNIKMAEELKYPEKMTLNWIWKHVPASYIWSFVLLLAFVFSLGVKFANTKLYKSLVESDVSKTKTTIRATE